MNDYTAQAYEMLGVAVGKNFGDAYLEVLGGGALGVTIPLGDNFWALLTSDYGLGIYELVSFENTGDALKSFYFTFDENCEPAEPIWKQTAKALEWLRDELNGLMK